MVFIFSSGGSSGTLGRDDVFIEAFRETSRRIFCSSLGESAGEAVIFLLKEAMKSDPFVALWENPKIFYNEMVKVFGEGAKILINLLITTVNQECGLNMDPKHFLDLMCEGSQKSLDEIRSFIRRVAEIRGGGIKS